MPFSNPITLGRPLTPAELADNFDLSQTLHDETQAARDQAVSAAGIFASTTAGISATTNGQYFCTPSVDSAEYLVLYLNNSGTAVEVSTYPSKAAVDAAIAAAEAAEALAAGPASGQFAGPVGIAAPSPVTLLQIGTDGESQSGLTMSRRASNFSEGVYFNCGSPQVQSYIGGDNTGGFIVRAGQISSDSLRIAPGGNAYFSGFARLGESGPLIKMKKLTGTTAAAASTNVSVAHGLNAAKILSLDVWLTSAWGGFNTRVTPNTPDDTPPDSLYYAMFDNTNVTIRTGPSGSSANVLSRPFIALVTYEE